MVAASPLGPSQYLTFTLDKEIYALEICQVQEVLDFTKITRVPGMPGFARGIINLRDITVPVVDLKLKFNGCETQTQTDTCIIIAQFAGDNDQVLLGILADSVREVLSLESEALDLPDKMGNRLKSSYIKGIGKKDQAFIIILDLDKLFSPGEMGAVDPTEPLPLTEKSPSPPLEG